MILSAISSVQTFDELGQVIVETCAKEFDAEVCTIWRRYTDDNGKPGLRLLAASAKAPQTLAQEITYSIVEKPLPGHKPDGVTGYVGETKKEVHVSSFEQLQQEYSFCWRGRMDNAQWQGKPDQHFHSLYAFPLILGERLVGVMKLENKRNSTEGFPNDDRAALRDLSVYVALTVHSFSLLEPHEERLIQVPAKMVQALLRPFEPRQLVSEIVNTVAKSLHAELCSLWLVDSSGEELRLADGYGFSTEARAKQTYQLTHAQAKDEDIDGITAWVAVRKKPFWANSWRELREHPSWRGKWDDPMWRDRSESFRCLYAVPLLREETVIGVLKVENRKDAAFFTDSDRALCGIMASLIVLVLDLGQQLRTSLISELVHLIRSPIHQVPMNLAGLERELKKLPKDGAVRFERIENYVNFIKKALFAVRVTSDTLTAFAQKGAPLPQELHPQRVNLPDLLTERVNSVKPLLYNGIVIDVNINDSATDAVVSLDVTDQTRIQIAIDNILHNAIKYSPEQGVVHVRLTREHNIYSLSIEDNGAGISEEDLQRIFEPGFSRHALDQPQGTGMGLTTVKQVLDRLRWQYHVQSEVGNGTSFKIKIPIEGE